MIPSSGPIFDLQINGWNGVDFNDDRLTGEQLRGVCEQLAERGVKRFLATVITERIPVLVKRLARLSEILESDPLVSRMIVGIHLEGPFLNPNSGFIGAHQAGCVVPATSAFASEVFDAACGKLRLVTLAPEMDAGFKATGWLAKQGVRVAAGHCDPTLDQLKGAIDAGLSLFTHLGNACPATLPRHDNVIQRALSLSNHLYITLIGDGQHVPLFALWNYLQIIGPDRAILVSDVTAAGGRPPGGFELNGRAVIVDDQGAARLADQPELLAGSTSLLPEVMSLLHRELGFDEGLLRRLTWTNPLRAFGIHESEAATA